MSKRKIKRDKFANDMAKEIRYQFTVFGFIRDTDKVYKILTKWMNVTGKEKYDRPI